MPRFVLEPRLYWSDKDGMAKTASWNADIYVLCYFYWRDPATADIMNLDQWKFWVFRKEELVKLMGGRKSVTILALEKEGYKHLTVFELKNVILG